jgi:ATP-dependent RNA helicase SUPV3L1/SUV3
MRPLLPNAPLKRSADVALNAAKPFVPLARPAPRRLGGWKPGKPPWYRLIPSLPPGLHAGEAERWIQAGIVPVARRVALRRGGRTVREPEFDPAVLKPLRQDVPAWRQADRRGRPADTRPKPGEGARTSNATIARVAGLDRYAAHFATARALNRRLVACLGPTNSGKTYFGLSRLAEAESGVILGPLRLLAHEYREALEGQGVATALSTGEERIACPAAAIRRRLSRCVPSTRRSM